MIRLLLLADHASTHVIKWAGSLCREGVSVTIFSLSAASDEMYGDFPAIRVFRGGLAREEVVSDSSKRKWKYLLMLKQLKRLIREYQPDIVHAHYASSYGLLGALSGFHPLVISVWGSDVFDFPQRSFFHRKLLEYNLLQADKVLSTSQVMARQTAKYTSSEVEVTPFGIDLERFRPAPEGSGRKDIVIGTIKMLEETYGIHYLIPAFAKVREKHPDLPLKLLIVGSGSQEARLKKMCSEFGIESVATFTGWVPYREIVSYYNQLDIYAAVSLQESFGVAVLEASACGKPVVVADVGGLPEVVEKEVTGIVVPPANVEKTAVALERLVIDEELRKRMGENGRKMVKERYDWTNNLQQMISIYRQLITGENDR